MIEMHDLGRVAERGERGLEARVVETRPTAEQEQGRSLTLPARLGPVDPACGRGRMGRGAQTKARDGGASWR
jgi:hypothetical protein